MKKQFMVFISVVLFSFLFACELTPEKSSDTFAEDQSICKLMKVDEVFDAEDGSRGNEVGNYSKDFSYICNGETYKLSDLRGKKVVLIKFWSLSCPYCIESLPKFEELHNKYKDKGLLVLAMNLRDSGIPISKLMKDYTFPNTFNSADFMLEGDIGKYIPLNILIDKDGIIQFIGTNAMPPKAQLLDLLGIK